MDGVDRLMARDTKVVPITSRRAARKRECLGVIHIGRTIVIRPELLLRARRFGSAPVDIGEYRLRSESCLETEPEETRSVKYAITSDNRVRIVPEGIADPADAELVFSSAEELAAGVAEWPLRRLINVWNKLPTVTTVKRFADRSVAVGRIWRAIDSIRHQLEPAAGSRIRLPKGELLVDLLRQPAGATLESLMSATGWQAHTVRGFISRKLPKASVQSFRRDGERVYRVSEPPQGQAS